METKPCIYIIQPYKTDFFEVEFFYHLNFFADLIKVRVSIY